MDRRTKILEFMCNNGLTRETEVMEIFDSIDEQSRVPRALRSLTRDGLVEHLISDIFRITHSGRDAAKDAQSN